MKRLWPFLLSLALAAPALAVAADGEASGFLPVPGDRVVFLGNTFIERDQAYGYLEAALTLRHPGHPILFRNLGWSGDTVFGEARASFDPPPVGYRRLKEHVLALQPTVIFVGYGAVESFDGPAGLPRFRDGLLTLLDTLAATKARIVLLSPLRQEDLGRPLPDPARHNDDLQSYCGAMQKVAADRGLGYIDLFHLPADAPRPLTDDGLHPTATGYWYLARVILKASGAGLPARDLDLDADQATRQKEPPGRATAGSAVVRAEAGGLKFRVVDRFLPFPPAPNRPGGRAASECGGSLRVEHLPPGKYTLKIDGEPVAKGLSAAELARSACPGQGPEFDQVERLRAAIVKKNLLYFYRWRPQNETYLFGFRKHEQGRNAAEIVQFDPLIAEQESVIARLSVPVPHTYELLSEDGKVGP